jgi:hypothetical protein
MMASIEGALYGSLLGFCSGAPLRLVGNNQKGEQG